MRTFAASTFLLGLLALVSAQTSSAPDQPPTKAKETKTLTLVGCVATDASAPGQYTLVDKDSGRYRLTGKDMSRYVGRQVQVTGGPKGFHVVGGLLPTPNAAAQAGAIDPTPAAAAATTGRGTGPEFRVKTVKAVPGTCAQ